MLNNEQKKKTIIRLQGNKKQIRDFDAVARGKSSYAVL